MPNTRRRRFSVKNDIGERYASKLQNGTSDSQQDHRSTETKSATQNIVTLTSNKSKNRNYPNSSKNTMLEIVATCESSSSVLTVMKRSVTTVDKDVTASSSNIDLFNILNSGDENFPNLSVEVNSTKENARRNKTQDKDRASNRKDKFPRQHRAKVRSPKRRVLMPESRSESAEITKRTIGTTTIDWIEESEMCNIIETDQMQSVSTTTEAIEITEPLEDAGNVDERNTEEITRISSHSIEAMCRICHGGEALSPELGQLISACSCRGTVGRVHVKCLEHWLTESGKSRCELCGTHYATKRVHRYGVPRALVMWILSQNTKQLLVDSLGIMLMSPLAVLAAWLSGRTFAGLMMQDSHVTPWPLASTFVLACMTLVCYYCWIVSAATRHALGWWIWYRSQYEVRLQIQNSEE